MAPYADDFSLFNTQGEFYRGGVWDPTPRSSKSTEQTIDISPTGNPVHATGVDKDTSSTNSREQAKKARLRQRKSTPDLRASRDIDADSELIPAMPSTLLRKGLHKHKSSDALRALPTDDSSNPFDINDHIGELQHLDSNADLGLKETSADSKSTLASTVKRWGSWYFKDNTSNTGSTSAKLTNAALSKKPQPASRRQSAPSESASVRREPSFKNKRQSPEVKPVSAPAPHKFPTELLNSIADDNLASLRPATGRSPARSNSMTDTASNRTMQKNMLSSYRKVEHAKSAYSLSDYSESRQFMRPDLNVNPLIESDKETNELDKNGSPGTSQSSNSVNLRKTKSIASSATRGSMGRKASEPYLASNRSLSFGSSETLANTLSNFKGELNNQDFSIPLQAPSLDQIPIELANPAVTPDSETNFSVPMLAPPPPMHDRALTKRRSKDTLRQSSLQSNPLPPSSTQPNSDPVITVPKPSLSAAPYSHERDLNDFLIETAAKYESSQLFDHLSIDRKIESSSSSSLPRTNSQKASEKSSNGEVLLESSSSFSQSSISGSLKASSTNELNESTPVLSYRKVKSKQSQGFKFF